MTRIFIKEFKAGIKINYPFLVKSKQLLPFKSKQGKFLHLVLGDKTGDIEARLWDAAEDIYPLLTDNNIVNIEGEVTQFRDINQINITAISISEKYVLEDLLPVSPRSMEEMVNDLKTRVAGIENKYLQELLKKIFSDKETFNKYIKAPAAKAHHHTYIGGLLEHTLGVAALAESMCQNYPLVNKDLLITGALLHDIGKIEELLFYDAIDYSDEGRLLGHIIMGVNMVKGHITQIPEFPEELSLKLLHMLVAHHGEYEFQSPKRPKFLEAVLLHYADLLDVQVDKFTKVKENAQENDAWSSWVRGLDRYVFLK